MGTSNLSDEDMPESGNQLEDTSQSEESEEEVEDVKVCDICGDAGLEELLAVCSRCSDGAEHTYCMQKKMKHLPEGDWLCEECKYKEETENHNGIKSEIDTETIKMLYPTKTKKSAISDLDPEYAPELDTKVAHDLEENKANGRLQNQQIASEVDKKTSERNSESSSVSRMKVDVKNNSLLSREDPLRNLGADKAKLVKLAGDQSAKKSILARSQTFAGPNSSKMSDLVQSLRGPLLKSGSFNNSKMKPKKVQFIENIPHKQSIGRECSDTRKGHVKKLTESSSFRGIRSSSSKVDPTTRVQSLQPPLAEDLRVQKERMGDKKIALPPSELKITDTNKGSHGRDNSGCNEEKSFNVSKNFGRSSSAVPAQKECQVAPHENLASFEKTSSSQITEFSHGNDKIKDNASKHAASGVSGLLRCKRCNETGHPTQFCSANKFPVTASKPPADRNARDHLDKVNKTKDASDIPVLNSKIHKDIRYSNYSEKSSLPFKDVGSSNCLERTTYGQETVKTLGVNIQAEASCASTKGNSNLLPQESPNTASVPSDLLTSSAIPELKFVWKGGFEVLKSGKLSKSCEGVQAHLSTFASRKVLETAVKIPSKIQLEEVAYVSSWPWHYMGYSPGDNNIALFFFAKDIESYEKNYSKLLEDMIKNDLALKGDIAGVELLVFPSNKLPPNSQRWNRLFFLWGVFRVKRSILSETLNQLKEKPSETNSRLEISVAESNRVQPVICENFQSTSAGLQTDASQSFEVSKNVNCMQNNFDSESMDATPHHKGKMEEKESLIESEVIAGFRPNRKRMPPTYTQIVDLNENIDFPLVDDTREHKKMKPKNYHEENASGSVSSKIHPYLFLRDKKDNEVIQIDDDDEGPEDIPNLELGLGVKNKLPNDKLSNLSSSNNGEDISASLDLSLAFH